MKRMCILSASVSLALIAGGCAERRPIVVACGATGQSERGGPALVGQPYGLQATAIPLDSVQYDGWETASRIAVQQLFTETTPSGTIRLQARLVSCADHPVMLRIRTSFLRRDLSPAEAPSAWRAVPMPPRALAGYEELSLTAEVAHYVIEISADR